MSAILTKNEYSGAEAPRSADRFGTLDLYRQVMRNWGTGVTIVTTSGRDGRPYGLTVSSFTSVSLEPVLVLVCLDNRLGGLQAFRDSTKFGVSILSDSQEELSCLFAKKDTVRSLDIFFKGKTGIPLLRNSLATLECETVAIYPGGDHSIFLGQVQSADVLDANACQKPLLYFRGQYGRLS